MADDHELDPVDWITAGAVGKPGERVFYLQARQAATYVALVLEKGQVAALAQLAQQLLADVGVVVTPDDLDVGVQGLVEPVAPAWRAGTLSLGADEDGTRFVLEATEVGDQDESGLAVARFTMDREALVGLAVHAAFVVQAGARERCRHCGRPIDAVDGHVCPSMNGHGALTT